MDMSSPIGLGIGINAALEDTALNMSSITLPVMIVGWGLRLVLCCGMADVISSSYLKDIDLTHLKKPFIKTDKGRSAIASD